MTTITDIKTQLGILNLKLTPIENSLECTDFYHYNEENKIFIFIDKQIAQEIQINPSIGLQLIPYTKETFSGYKIIKLDTTLSKDKDNTENSNKNSWISFKGKINRGQFAVRTLLCIVAFAIYCVFAISFFMEQGYIHNDDIDFLKFVGLVFMYFYIIQQGKRLRDMGLSVWFSLVPCCLYFLILICQTSIIFLIFLSIYTLFLMLCKKINFDGVKFKINTDKINIKKILNKLNFKLDNSEIIVVSVVVGTIFALILGYVFANEYYVKGNGRKGYNYENLVSEFNYLLALGSFIISGGITYLFLKKQNNKEY